MQEEDEAIELDYKVWGNLNAALVNKWPRPHPMPIYAGGWVGGRAATAVMRGYGAQELCSMKVSCINMPACACA